MPAKKKTPAKKAAKKSVKKTTVKKTPAKKASTQKGASKKTADSKTAAKAQSVVKKTVTEESTSPKKKVSPTKKAIVSRSGATAEKKLTPIVFSFDDVEELVAAKKSAEPSSDKEVTPEKAPPTPKAQPKKKIVVDEQPTEKRVLGAASLADILGFNPAEKKKKIELDDEEIPKKWKKYYRLLVDLRAHVSDEINLHTSETLKHSSRDDSGDLSSYGSHQADVGTDSFDRDFALSLVSSEQEALNEIEEAILRIKDGTYGMCEVTGKPIPAARLTAVPFARYSVEGQIEHEKNRHRKNNRSSSVGIFGDSADAPKLESSDDD